MWALCPSQWWPEHWSDDTAVPRHRPLDPGPGATHTHRPGPCLIPTPHASRGGDLTLAAGRARMLMVTTHSSPQRQRPRQQDPHVLRPVPTLQGQRPW